MTYLGRLYPFQAEGALFLAARERAYLADEMGLGKTVQAIAAARQLGLLPQDVVIVCPASVVENWRAEWYRWYDLAPGEPLIVSYNKMDAVQGHETPKLVIFDEAHYMKTPGAQRTRRGSWLAKQSQRVWMLSGTPMPNNATELYAQFKMLIPREIAALGIHSKFQWMQHFCTWTQTQFGVKVTGSKNTDRLRKLLAPVLLRRRQAQVLPQLPPLRIDHMRLEYDKEFAAGVAERSQGMLDPLQYPNDPHVSRLRRYIGQWKVEPIAHLLVEELFDDHEKKIVVLAHHRDVIDTLYDKLHSFGAVVLDGSTPSKLRLFYVDKFQTDPHTRVFIGQNTAAGIGINLTAARDIVLVEPPWSPDDMMQGIKRIHRIGQGGSCRARVYSCPNTLDDSIIGTLVQKTRMIDATIN